MFELVGYPELFFYVFGIIGLIFFIKKPQYTFWMGIFYFSAREGGRAALTRTPLFGPYFNLDDFLILLMLISLIHLSFSHKIKIPSIVYWIAICIFASILIMAAKYDLSYPVQREHKWALYFPLAMFLSYNFFLKEKDFETFLKILFIGSIVASIQYIFVTQEKIQMWGTVNNQESFRSVAFIGLIPIFIITGFFLKIKWLDSFKVRIIYFAGLSLMIINLMLSQTRSFYISIALTIFIIFLLRKEIKFKSSFLFIAFLPFLVYIVFDQYLGLLNINDLIFGRIQLLSDNPSTDVSTLGRMAALQYEFAAFLSSNIIFGNGLGFTSFLPEAYNPYIAWGHIGHIAYLARLGLLGFIIYSLYIPFTALKYLIRSKPAYIKFSYTKIFLIFATALIFSDWIQFWMSASYLNLTAFLSGSIIGTVWALKDKRINLTRYSNDKVKNVLPQN
ncbi:MAG: hypothetical protein B6D44_06730 [Ignavibacteriales bacterium UTCHB2]|nr:MAG: hypothetical protein B6D44_06730 [Ignavibacteriales bacterium UTCHB2]